VNNNLGLALQDKGRLGEAVAAHRQAIRLRPRSAKAHTNLGVALRAQRKLDEAVNAHREAVRLDPKLARAHTNLGVALHEQGRLAEAVAAHREAVRLDPKLARAHTNLGLALRSQGRPGEAVAALRRAIALSPRFATAHHNLGLALHAAGRLGEAVAAFRHAICLDPTYALAPGALGQALHEQGKFAEARAAAQRCLDLLPPRHPLREDVAQQLRQSERCLALEERLPALLRGEARPAGAADRVALGQFCLRYQERYAAAARFYAEAFAEEPRLAEDVRAGHRSDAARAAALAAGGHGRGAARPDDREQARLRRQALGWLRADLAAWAALAEKATPQDSKRGSRALRRWRQDPALGGLRDKGELARLPKAERQACRDLWAEVDAVLRRLAQDE
jgi:tetratricopeptide (TPR) repeat protein